MGVAELRFADSLAREHQEQYHRDGFVKVPAVFSSGEVNELRQEADRLFQRTDLIDSDNILRNPRRCETAQKHIFSKATVSAWRVSLETRRLNKPGNGPHRAGRCSAEAAHADLRARRTIEIHRATPACQGRIAARQVTQFACRTKQ
jgi:hypothetical protein